MEKGAGRAVSWRWVKVGELDHQGFSVIIVVG